MPERARARPAGYVPWSLLAAGYLMLGVALYLAAHPPPDVRGLELSTVLFGTQFLALSAAGALIAARRPSHPVGWLLVAQGVVLGATGLISAAARLFYVSQPAVGAVMTNLGNQLAKVSFVLLAVVLLVFPTGRLLSTGWRWLLASLLLLLLVATAVDFFRPGPVTDYLVAAPPLNPLGVPAFQGLASILARVGFPLFSLLVLVAAGSVVVRYRRGDLELRLQLKWFVLAAALWALAAVLDGAHRITAAVPSDWPALPFEILYQLGTLAMAAAVGIAILRHRLFDVDLIISRTVAYGFLAGLITAFYIAVVAGIGSILAAGSSSRLLLSVVAVAAVAAVFQPLRVRLERIANGLVYGPRAGPYEVLAEFTASIDAGGPVAEILPSMARLLALGTASEGSAVFLLEAGTEVAAASWPGDEVFEQADVRSVSVSRTGERLGRLAVYRSSGKPLTPTEERLMDGLALHAGLVLNNAVLRDELGERLRELIASRQRLVTAQDEERRRLERDLHDGAQQDLVALRMKLGLAADVARRNPGQVGPLLDEMQSDLGQAIDELRNLARGVYPPLLEADGLRAALIARARQTPLTVDVRCGRERYSREVEGAVYFCCSEALQNVVKHAQASSASIRIWRDENSLAFEIVDDGRGFPPDHAAGTGMSHMRDRAEALGGSVLARSVSGGGVAVTGTLSLGSGFA